MKMRRYMKSGGVELIEEKVMVSIHHSNAVSLCQEILDELERSENIHPNWPTDPVHAGAILAEEAGEVVKAINNVVTKHKEDSDYRTEAVQCAAMCIRFLKNLERYDWEIPY